MAMRKQIICQVLHSRAASTIKSSLTQYRKFTNFVKESQIPGKFPYTTLVISHYLSHLKETKKSYSVTLQSQCAIKWVHDLVPLASNPADAPLIHNIIEAGKRSPRTSLLHRGFDVLLLKIYALDGNFRELCARR